MCGFAGLFRPHDADLPGMPDIVSRMIGTLTHRGPDAEGLWAEGGWRWGIGACPFSISSRPRRSRAKKRGWTVCGTGDALKARMIRPEID